MGTFATTTALQTLMVGVTFDTATTALASKCIDLAENEVKKYLSKRYDMSAWTAGSVPIVTSIAEQLSEGFTWRRVSRPTSKENINRGDDLIVEAKENLQMILDGDVILVNGQGSVLSERSDTSEVLCNTKDYHDTFAEDSELNWETDEDKLDAIEDERE